MAQTIQKITSLNPVVDRIVTDKNYTIDVYNPLFNCNEGDIIHIVISDTPITDTEYLMSGMVYRVDNEISCISAGGLLCSVPSMYTIYSNLYISISKTKKTKSRVKENSSRKKKLKN